MTKNQKIALGCGGGGCLLLIVAGIIVAVGYFYVQRKAPDNHGSATNYNSNTNRNSNSNSNSNNANSSSSSTSDDDRHKLYYCATVTSDGDLMKRVNRKLGLTDSRNVPTDSYTEFAKDHIIWIIRNTDWMKNCDTKEKARNYVDQHIND
jgi:hypothetical protein